MRREGSGSTKSKAPTREGVVGPSVRFSIRTTTRQSCRVAMPRAAGEQRTYRGRIRRHSCGRAIGMDATSGKAKYLRSEGEPSVSDTSVT